MAALVLLHFSGSLSEEAEGVLVGPLLMVSAAVGALAGGLPMWMLPAPLLAAAGLAMFYDTRALRDYLLFVAGALGTGACPLPGRCARGGRAAAGLGVLEARWGGPLPGPLGRGQVRRLAHRHVPLTHPPPLPPLPPCPPTCCHTPGAWFVWHHFWFLDVQLGPLHLRAVCCLVVGAMLPAALLPGLLYSGALRRPPGWLPGWLAGWLAG